MLIKIGLHSVQMMNGKKHLKIIQQKDLYKLKFFQKTSQPQQSQQQSSNQPFNFDPSTLTNLFSNLGPIISQFTPKTSQQSGSQQQQGSNQPFNFDPSTLTNLFSNLGPIINQFTQGSSSQGCCSTKSTKCNDNGEVKHFGVVCDGCDGSPIIGNRFKCNDCKDFDLCSKCYENNNKHDKTHTFTNLKQPVGSCAFFRDFIKEAQQQKSQETKPSTSTTTTTTKPTSSVEDIIIMDQELYEDPMKVEQKPQEIKIVEQKPQEIKIQPVQVNQQSTLQQQHEEKQLKEGQQFTEQLDLLKSMGFENAPLNSYLLTKFQGNIQKKL